MIPNTIANLCAVYRYADEPTEGYRVNPVKAFKHLGEPMVFDLVQGRLVLAGAELLDENEIFVGVWVVHPEELTEPDGEEESG